MELEHSGVTAEFVPVKDEAGNRTNVLALENEDESIAIALEDIPALIKFLQKSQKKNTMKSAIRKMLSTIGLAPA